MSKRRRTALAIGILCALGSHGLSAQGRVAVDVGARDPAISPNGSVIALSILGKIWTVPMDGGTASQVTHGVSWDTRPAWSPDGGFLAYASRTGSGTDLVVRNVATGGSRFVHRVPAAIGQIAFSPDGDHLYFVNDRNQYDAHVWRIPVGGGQAEQLTHTQNWHEWSFALSPDGARIVLENGRYEGTDLYEMRLEDMSMTRLTNVPARTMSVAMSRDGSHRAHVESLNGIDHVVLTEDGAEPRRIHTSAYDHKQLVFGPSGDWLLVVAGRRLHRLDLDGGDLSPIPFEARFAVADAPPDDLVITNVRVFDGTGDSEIPAATVRVRDGRIVDVVEGASPAGTEFPADATVIDGAGRLLMPGLMDNHLHFWAPPAGSDLLSSGVTAIRDPGSMIADIMDYKDAIRLGILSGPDVFAAGPLIDGFGGYHPLVDVSIDDPAAAPALVRSLKEQGVDLLKTYFQLDPDVLEAVVAEAKVQGLPVTGHIGVRASWNQAMDAGIDGFNHIRVWRDFLPADVQVDGRNESLDGSRNPIGRMQADWREIDPESAEVTALLERMAATGTALDPTLYVQRIDDNARSRFSLGDFAIARQSYDRMGAFVRRAVELGVPLLAGTDNAGLFNELEAYEAAGVSNAAILRSATVNGARWMGREEDFGTVEPGKRAHLILVDGDPLEDMSELRNIDLVVKDGVIVFRR